MSNLKALLKKYWHIVFVLYFPIYMVAFVALEKKSFDNYTFMHCAIDDMIPFCRFFIIPYILWFAYMAVFLVFFFFYSREEFISYAWYLITGMSICLIIYAVWPSKLDLRPETLEGNDIFTVLVNMIYSTDTPTNVCPSIHCLNSFATHIAISKCDYFKKRPVIRYASALLVVLICLSTMFLKQHSFIDVVCAVILGAFLYLIIYSRYSIITSRSRKRTAIFSSTLH